MMSETLLKILDEIKAVHKKMDELLEGCSDVEKAFILGSYVWDLNVRKKKEGS